MTTSSPVCIKLSVFSQPVPYLVIPSSDDPPSHWSLLIFILPSPLPPPIFSTGLPITPKQVLNRRTPFLRSNTKGLCSILVVLTSAVGFEVFSWLGSYHSFLRLCVCVSKYIWCPKICNLLYLANLHPSILFLKIKRTSFIHKTNASATVHMFRELTVIGRKQKLSQSMWILQRPRSGGITQNIDRGCACFQ